MFDISQYEQNFLNMFIKYLRYISELEYEDQYVQERLTYEFIPPTAKRRRRV